MEVMSQTTVAAPIEVVWDTFWSDHVGMMGWGLGATVTMDRPGTAEANGVGAVRRIATPGPGPDIVEEVVTYEPPNVMGYKALSGTPFPGYPSEMPPHPGGERHKHQLHDLVHCVVPAGEGSASGYQPGAAASAGPRRAEGTRRDCDVVQAAHRQVDGRPGHPARPVGCDEHRHVRHLLIPMTPRGWVRRARWSWTAPRSPPRDWRGAPRPPDRARLRDRLRAQADDADALRCELGGELPRERLLGRLRRPVAALQRVADPGVGGR